MSPTTHPTSSSEQTVLGVKAGEPPQPTLVSLFTTEYQQRIDGALLSEEEKTYITTAVQLQDALMDMAALLKKWGNCGDPQIDKACYLAFSNVHDRIKQVHRIGQGNHTMAQIGNFVVSTSYCSWETNSYYNHLLMMNNYFIEAENRMDWNEEDRIAYVKEKFFTQHYPHHIFHIHATMILPHFITWIWQRRPKLTSYGVIDTTSNRFDKLIAPYISNQMS